jgi:hypothetical protein
MNIDRTRRLRIGTNRSRTRCSRAGDVEMPKALLSLGGVGVLTCLVWWGNFYTEALRRRGSTSTARDWEAGVGTLADCLFWDRAQCVAAKSMMPAGAVAYEPMFLWLAFGVVIAGFILAFRKAAQR